MPTIYYKSSEKKIDFEEGTEVNVLRTSIRYEAMLPYKCGGGICGTCKMHVEEGAENLSPIKKHEQKMLGDLLNEGYRLGCQTFTTGDVTVTWDTSVDTPENKKLKEYWLKQQG